MLKHLKGLQLLRRTLATSMVFLAAILHAHAAQSQTLGTAFTDLWWNPAESGWGVTIDHQQNVMFLTFFIYRADTSPYWVTATLTRVGTNPLLNPPHVFGGDLYETKGPAFGGPFNPALVTPRKVGTATFTANAVNTATLQYSIDGANVTKNLQRQTLRFIDYSGNYFGGGDWVLSNCSTASNNNQEIVTPARITIVQSGTAFSMTNQLVAGSCTYNGTYDQAGLIGQVSGTYTCTDGSAGPFSLNALQWSIFGFNALISGQNQSCSFQGVMGGSGFR